MADPATSLHEHALQAEKHLEQLATGLAHAQADPGTVQTVTKMADVARKIVAALGSGQEQTSDTEAPAQPAQPEQPHTMDSATSALHQDMQASAAAR